MRKKGRKIKKMKINRNATTDLGEDALIAPTITQKINNNKWNGCANMGLMQSASIAWISSLFQILLTFPSINFCWIRNLNAKEFIHQRLNVEIAFLLHKFSTRLTETVNIMSPIPKLCAINVSLQMLLSKGSSSGMWTMWNLWMLRRFPKWSNIGFRKNIWHNRELDSSMVTMLKILTTKEVSELLLRQFINRNRKALIILSKFWIHLMNYQKSIN